ncbi:ParB/RepB/Spo0J family partition protein [Thiocystis violascens]|uniref:ParB-like nuclease n=1 Tax=Thiocystis violascens (strain ATCC 17096 / DSM 198 / 6111) TaxID=765911 RepID=I3YHD7_THIV6|nr:ParB/RepB/Spo0J family partition protein [Thiocystis violascens]AFL76405.1 ParB-like nuclease [Thiocystis violascens DSM 198]
MTSPQGTRAQALKRTSRGIQIKPDIGETILPGSASLTNLPISSISVDQDIQQREGMDDALVAEYGRDIGEWIARAPVTVFAADGVHVLADGFHRLEACKAAGLESVPVIKHDGGKVDALRFAIGANAKHGRRRTQGDMSKAYSTAIAEGFCQADDTGAVAALLNCSTRWASDLTREAREQAKVERDATIQKLADEGKTQREIAASVGMHQTGVKKILDDKRNPSKSHQTPEPSDPVPDIPVSPDPVIIEEMQGDDLDAIRQTTAKLKADQAPPAPAAKGPTAKDAMHAAHQVTGSIGILYRVDSALLASDAKTLISELRKALERYTARFPETMEGNGHA